MILPLAYSWAILLTSVDKLYICTTLSYWSYLVYVYVIQYLVIVYEKECLEAKPRCILFHILMTRYCMINLAHTFFVECHDSGADPGFRGAHLNKLRRAEGGAKIVGVFRVKNPPLWLPIITNLGSLSQIRLNEHQLKSISFNYNILYEKYSITQDKESMG